MTAHTDDADAAGPVLVVGYTAAMMKALDKFRPDDSVIFVDEPSVARKRDAATHLAGARSCRGLIEWEYQLPVAADTFYHRHADLRPAAVVPGVEYAVPFAGRLAERFGVPGATAGAAEILRDKWKLRQVAGAAGIANPLSRPVAGPAELRAFMQEVGGPTVLKPANRQAAVGTWILQDLAEVDRAWAACIDQDEGIYQPDRGIPVRMLAEQCVHGPEFSVEMMLADGEQLFGNVTAKVLYPGHRPIELGHTVPADVPPDLTELLLAETVRTLAAAGFGTGFVHCEWIVDDGVPYLVECAGRMPGDGIIELIEHAWPIDIVPEYYRVMSGLPMSAPAPATPAARGAVWFLHVDPGEVVSVDGVDEGRAVPGVITCDVVVHPGDRTHELRSSWDRIAIATAAAPTTAEALAAAQQAIDRITVKVRPVD